jgi:aminoglycoside phosphotransferase (APT) family kinase protein
VNRRIDLTAVREVVNSIGIRTGELDLLSPGGALSSGGTLVVRDRNRAIRFSQQSITEAQETLHLANQLAAAGAPVLLPLDSVAAETLLGTVTIWELATPSPEPERDLGSVLGLLHRIELPGVRHRAGNRPRIKREVMGLEQHGVEPGVIEELRAIAARLPDQPAWVHETNRVVHGDAHRGNVMRRNGRPVLIDLGNVHHGPAELDLLPTWCAARRAGDGWWAWQRLRDTYRDTPGEDGLWDWPHLEEAVLERELMTTLFLSRRWRDDPGAREEVTHRVRTWEDTTSTWETGLRR